MSARKPMVGPVALPLDDRDDAAGRDPFVDLVDAEFAQPFDHESRRLVAVELEFGVPVHPAPPFLHVVGKIGDAVDDGHVDSPCLGLR